MEKRTAITYIDTNGNWHRSSKGAPEQVRHFLISNIVLANILVHRLTHSLLYQIIDLCELKGDVRKKAHEIIDNFANRGLRSLGVARQVS